MAKKHVDIIIGSMVARDIGKYLEDSKSIELVPWVSDPKSDLYDPIQVAEQRGWARANFQAEVVMAIAKEDAKEEISKIVK